MSDKGEVTGDDRRGGGSRSRGAGNVDRGRRRQSGFGGGRASSERITPVWTACRGRAAELHATMGEGSFDALRPPRRGSPRTTRWPPRSGGHRRRRAVGRRSWRARRG